MLRDLLGFDIGQIFAQIGQLIYSPTTNVLASSLLLLAIITVLAIILVAIILVVLARRRGEDGDEVEYAELLETYGDEVLDEGEGPSPHTSRFRAFAFLLGLIVLVWVATGVSTAASAVCTPCHADLPHAKLKDGAPHAGMSCTRCHEPGSIVSQSTLAVPSRLVHMAEGLRGTAKLSEYGRVDSSSCRSCHENVVKATTENERRGIKVSHKEPVAAGARCIDCHRPNDVGVISGAYGGMNPCMRCHDGVKESNDCTLCHTRDIGYSAVADHMPSPLTAKDLVPAPKSICYTCHDPKPCDSCHGMRIPHSKEFIEGGHAYEGVKSIWAGSNGSCTQCHSEERNSCVKSNCHGSEFPYHYQADKNFPTSHATGRWIRTDPGYVTPSNLGCATCHAGTICTMCHEARPATPLPNPDLTLDEE